MFKYFIAAQVLIVFIITPQKRFTEKKKKKADVQGIDVEDNSIVTLRNHFLKMEIQ